MPNYTLSYYVKGAKKFEDNAQVINKGNGWFQVIKKLEATSQELAIEYSNQALLRTGGVTWWPQLEETLCLSNTTNPIRLNGNKIPCYVLKAKYEDPT